MTNPLRLMQLAKLLDITRLQDNDNDDEFTSWMIAQPQLPVAAFCVYPQFIPKVKQWSGLLPNTALATVVNFPSGNLAADIVCDEITDALALGATEIDCVLPYKALLRGEYGLVKSFLYDVRQAASGACLKIIIESGELVTAQQVGKAAELAIEGGADFVKTSTGKVPVGVTDEAARIILTVIAAADREVGFKASGGVRTVDHALSIMNIYEEITGKVSVSSGMRIGASALVTELVTLMGNKA